MDLLYSRYADPGGFMSVYIEQGRFGEFVARISEMNMQRKKEAVQKENDDRLWLAYIHTITDKSFYSWKEEMLQVKESAHYAMTDSQVDSVKQQAKEILNRITPI